MSGTAYFARGYDPTQYCWPNAQNPLEWDELAFYASQHPILRAIQKLARAKILQALIDVGSESKKPEAIGIRNQAFAWIFSDQSDFRAFCSDAGFSPRIVRQKAKEIMDYGISWRAEAGCGARYEERKRYRERIQRRRQAA